VYLSNRFALTGSTNVFSAGYSELSPEVNSWAASLNSPFNLDNFTLGFSLTF
jgi:hypothetical protein